ncbi:MAG: efflux RND transporter periplasmic adaptor subunit, partial [Pseudomonas sp.]
MASPGLKTAVMLSLFALLSACGEKKAPAEYLPRVFVQEV